MQKQNDDIYQGHRGNWNHPQNIQKTPQQHACEEWHQETKENNYIGHCAVTSESSNTKEQNIQHEK